jgi:hypothetical protein
MASVFWDAEGIDYLDKGRAITGDYHSRLHRQLDVKIRKKRIGLEKNTICHMYNAPARKGASAIGKLWDLG